MSPLLKATTQSPFLMLSNDSRMNDKIGVFRPLSTTMFHIKNLLNNFLAFQILNFLRSAWSWTFKEVRRLYVFTSKSSPVSSSISRINSMADPSPQICNSSTHIPAEKNSKNIQTWSDVRMDQKVACFTIVRRNQEKNQQIRISSVRFKGKYVSLVFLIEIN